MSEARNNQESKKTSGIKHTRNRLWPLLLHSWPFWLVLVALVMVSVLFVPFTGTPLLSLITTRDTRVTDLVLEEVKDIYRFSSVEYLYRVVFPYDFMPPGVSESTILKKVSLNLGVSPQKLLEPEEQEYLKVIQLAQKYKLNLKAPDYHFLVATVILRAGFDLSSTTDQNWVQITEGEAGSKTAELTLPEARILDVRVEDPIRENYPFPDVPLSPEGWKEISGLLMQHAQRLSIQDGILDKARDNASSFLSRMLLNSGFSKVSFSSMHIPEKDEVVE